MRRELVQLRQLVRQFVDYTRLKTDRGLALGSAPAPVKLVLDDIAFALAMNAHVHVRAPEALAVRADPDRLHQMVLSLAVAVLRSSAGDAEVALAAVADGGRVDIVVDGGAPDGRDPIGFDEGGAAGIGLHVTRELALAQGGDVRAHGTTRYVLTLPLDDGAG
jgi:signal transduction histidine kinase